MTLEGSLDERELREVLGLLAQHQRTGILTVQGSREIIALSFLKGEVVSADALNQTLEDGLGKVLDDLELVSPEDFAGLAAEHQAGGGRVVELLVERGFVSRRDLLGALRLHTYRLSRQALSWREGEFKFYQGEEVSFEEGITPIPTAELLFRASRDLANPRLFEGSYPEAGSVFARNPGAFDASGLGNRRGEGPMAAVAEMGEEAAEVFSRVNGETSVRGLVRVTGVPEFRVTYLLHRWLRLGLVEAVAERPEETVASSVLEVESAGSYLPSVVEEAESRREAPELWRKLEGLWRVESPPSAPLRKWPARVAGLALLAVLAVFAAVRPGRYLHVETAGSPASAGAAGLRYESLHRAAATFFLLYGRYPEEASMLIDLGLISPRDLVDQEGREIQFSSSAVSYVLSGPLEKEGGLRAGAVTGTIIGDFLLDPDFGLGEVPEEPPLVLLD